MIIFSLKPPLVSLMRLRSLPSLMLRSFRYFIPALTRSFVIWVPLSGAPSRFPSSARASSSLRAFSSRLVSLNEVVVSGLSVLTDGPSYPFTLARTTPGKARRLTCNTICAWIAQHWITSG